MSRPQKYTDSDIISAIEFLASAGEDINPLRVRTRLGGGNVGRIKAIIEQQAGQLAQTAASIARAPEGLSREFHRASGEISQQMLLLANKCWLAACNEAASAARDESVRLRTRLEKLEVDLAASTELLVQLEGVRDGMARDLDLCMKQKDELAVQCEHVKAALRNAESDLRAGQRMIENFERSQREDREEIRQLQRRIEDLVAALATVKASSSNKEPTRKKMR